MTQSQVHILESKNAWNTTLTTTGAKIVMIYQVSKNKSGRGAYLSQINHGLLIICLTSLSGKYPLNENEVEMENNQTTINNSTLMECSDSSVEIVEINYGHKPYINQNMNDFCYPPQTYLDALQCSQDVSNLTL